MHYFVWEMTTVPVVCMKLCGVHILPRRTTSFSPEGHFLVWKYAQLFSKWLSQIRTMMRLNRALEFSLQMSCPSSWRGWAWVRRPAPGSHCPVTATWLWLDIPQLCHLSDDSWVCHRCLSGWPWSSNEVVAVKAPDSCDTRSCAPISCGFWGPCSPEARWLLPRLDTTAHFWLHFASLSPPIAPSPASALDPLTSLFLPLKEFFWHFKIPLDSVDFIIILFIILIVCS